MCLRRRPRHIALALLLRVAAAGAADAGNATLADASASATAELPRGELKEATLIAAVIGAFCGLVGLGLCVFSYRQAKSTREIRAAMTQESKEGDMEAGTASSGVGPAGVGIVSLDIGGVPMSCPALVCLPSANDRGIAYIADVDLQTDVYDPVALRSKQNSTASKNSLPLRGMSTPSTHGSEPSYTSASFGSYDSSAGGAPRMKRQSTTLSFAEKKAREDLLKYAMKSNKNKRLT